MSEMLYDSEEELKNNTDEINDMTNKSLIYDADIHPAKYNQQVIPETVNIFDKGVDVSNIIESNCPICTSNTKDVKELKVREKRFSLKWKKIGYMSVCANCGHVSFFTDKPINFLLYLRGKVR